MRCTFDMGYVRYATTKITVRCTFDTCSVLCATKVSVRCTFDIGNVRYVTTKITVRCTFDMGYVRYATTKITVLRTFDMGYVFLCYKHTRFRRNYILVKPISFGL